jgi:hypothetical protein
VRFQLRPLLFWDVMHCRFVVCYYHFATTCLFHLQGSSFTREHRTDRLSQNVSTSQKIEGLYFLSVQLSKKSSECEMTNASFQAEFVLLTFVLMMCLHNFLVLWFYSHQCCNMLLFFSSFGSVFCLLKLLRYYSNAYILR